MAARTIRATPDNATEMRALVSRWPELDALVRGLQAQGVFPGLRALSVTMTGQPDWVGQGVAAVLDDGYPQ